MNASRDWREDLRLFERRKRIERNKQNRGEKIERSVPGSYQIHSKTNRDGKRSLTIPAESAANPMGGT